MESWITPVPGLTVKEFCCIQGREMGHSRSFFSRIPHPKCRSYPAFRFLSQSRIRVQIWRFPLPRQQLKLVSRQRFPNPTPYFGRTPYPEIHFQTEQKNISKENLGKNMMIGNILGKLRDNDFDVSSSNPRNPKIVGSKRKQIVYNLRKSKTDQ